MTAPLPDPLALHLLTTLAAPRLRAAAATSPDTPPTPDLLAALADAFGPAPASPPPTDADLARAAIALAAASSSPATRDAIDALLDQPTTRTYTPVVEAIETITAVTAALTILQTEVTIKRTPAGKWTIELHKRPASDALLKALAHAILRALGGEGEQPNVPPRLPK